MNTKRARTVRSSPLSRSRTPTAQPSPSRRSPTTSWFSRSAKPGSASSQVNIARVSAPKLTSVPRTIRVAAIG